MKSSLNEWCKRIHTYAKDKGWWEVPKSPLEVHMLIVSEISEATEEVRDSKPPIYYNVEFPDGTSGIHPCSGENGLTQTEKLLKPEGEAIELADAVIRVMDYFAYMGWDLEHAVSVKHGYNLTREYKHGGKKL